MDLEDFDRTLGKLTASLGDPTRRGIYIAVREADDPMTAGEVAQAFDIHPNVARHHLDRLAEDGYLTVETRRPTSGAGRPAKGFRVTPKPIEVQLSPRRTDLLVDLLLAMLGEVGGADISAVARRVGRAYGHELAAGIGPADDPIGAVATAMATMGFETSADPEAGVYLTNHCPFGETARTHPEIVCALDQGIVDGLLEVLDPGYRSRVVPHPDGTARCETHLSPTVPVAISNG